MTFKGMLKIVMNDYRKQQVGFLAAFVRRHRSTCLSFQEERMFSVVGELMRTRQELLDVQAQLRRVSRTIEPSTPWNVRRSSSNCMQRR